MELQAQATNGARCLHERHRFRIGVEATAVTEFNASAKEFSGRLNEALIEHVTWHRAGSPSTGLYLQVWTAAGWCNVQEPPDGNVVAVTHQIADQPQTGATLFSWACNSVQLFRDLDVIAQEMAREANV